MRPIILLVDLQSDLLIQYIDFKNRIHSIRKKLLVYKFKV